MEKDKIKDQVYYKLIIRNMKKNYFILLMCWILSVQFLSAQNWEEINRVPWVNNYDIDMSDDGMIGYSVGNNYRQNLIISQVLKTTNGGVNWNSIPFPDSTTIKLRSCSFVDENTGWIVGSEGKIYKTINGGSTWNEQTSNSNRMLTKVKFISSLTGWIIGGENDGNSYLVLKTIDGGNTWQDYSFGTENYAIKNLCFIDSLTGWFCGSKNANSSYVGHIFKTIDGGLTWVEQTLPSEINASGFLEVSSIDFSSPTRGWATISSMYTSPLGPILFTNDGGATWTVSTVTANTYNYAVTAVDSLNIFLTSHQISASSIHKLFYSTNGGQSWSNNNLAIPAYVYDIAYANNKLWITSTNSAIISTTNRGLTWTWEYIAASLRQIAWASPSKGWITAGLSELDKYTLVTNNGGLTWDESNSAPGGNHIFFVDDLNGWTLYPGLSSKINRTTDSGTTWTQNTIGTTNNIQNIYFINPTRGFAFGANGALFLTTNGGTTWTQKPLATQYFIQDIIFSDSQNGFLCGGYSTGSGFLYKTNNGGNTWTSVSIPTTDHLYKISFTDSNNGWIAGYGGSIIKTTDGGATWTQTAIISKKLSGLIMIDNLNGYVCAYNDLQSSDGKGFIYKTIDGGTSWSICYSSDLPFSVFNHFSKNNNSVWLVGEHGLILSIDIATDIISIKDNENNIKIGQPFPNPFQNEIEFDFETKGTALVDVTVLDLQGRTVCNLINSKELSGLQKIKLNAQEFNLSSGLYYFKLNINGISHAIPIILE